MLFTQGALVSIVSVFASLASELCLPPPSSYTKGVALALDLLRHVAASVIYDGSTQKYFKDSLTSHSFQRYSSRVFLVLLLYPLLVVVCCSLFPNDQSGRFALPKFV